jgi:chromate transport protein ChrA
VTESELQVLSELSGLEVFEELYCLGRRDSRRSVNEPHSRTELDRDGHHLGWLTDAQLMDAIAAGQITPGPVFTTATFVGYVVAGPRGALVATAGIFLPAFIFVAVSGPLVPRIRASATAGAFLDGVNVASLALMVVVTFQLGRAALMNVGRLGQS